MKSCKSYFVFFLFLFAANCRSPNFFGGGCPANNYLVTGFSALQAIVDEILIQVMLGAVNYLLSRLVKF